MNLSILLVFLALSQVKGITYEDVFEGKNLDDNIDYFTTGSIVRTY